MTISDNINISVMESDSGPGGIRRFGKEETRARQSFENLGIKSPSAKITVGALSGGNQQKVLLARLLEAKPKVIILDEPTRGVDVGAKSEIYRLIDGLAQQGIAIVMISSELPEIIGVSDRVLVMREGVIAGEISPKDGKAIEQEDIMRLSTGPSSGPAGNHPRQTAPAQAALS